jgi:succinate dehydrogenase / fumarate reductase flavoprotein subunit
MRGLAFKLKTAMIGWNRRKSPDYDYIEQRLLVIGVGGAGARTAIELVERGVDPQKILVIGKRAH